MTVMRGEYKTPGGKLVAVNVEVGDDATSNMLSTQAADNAASYVRPVRSCRVDGDFFIEGDDAAAQSLIEDLEHALMVGRSVSDVIAQHRANARLVGTNATAIETAYARALGVTQTALCHQASPDSSLIPTSQETDHNEDWMADRWAQLHPIIIHDIPREPVEQMTIDEQWAREVAQGERPATIRFWEWVSPAIVVGRYQSIPDEVHEREAEREGFTVVRRCTGGGAMVIVPGNTITYSVYAPLSFVAGISIEESYRLCDRWLINMLHSIGIDATFAGINDIASSHGKIGGAAQRRFPARSGPASTGPTGPGSVLHHVTMAYDIDAEQMTRVLNTSAEKLSDKAVKSARKRVDPLRSQTGMTRDEIVNRMIEYLRSL